MSRERRRSCLPFCNGPAGRPPWWCRWPDAAALQAPELASVRYARASLLAMAARAPEAVAELAAALKLDDALRDKARADEDFADLRDRDDYKDLMAR